MLLLMMMLMLASTGGNSGIVSGTCSDFIPMERANDISEAILVIYQLMIRETSPSNVGRPVHFWFCGLGSNDLFFTLTYVRIYVYICTFQLKITL